MIVFTIDVWFAFDRNYHEDDWRRYVISANDPTEAELIAVQMCYAIHSHPVRSCVIDPL